MQMTLADLMSETLVAKNRRLRQAKCPHSEIYCSTVFGPSGTFENRFCLDCGKHWRFANGQTDTDHKM